MLPPATRSPGSRAKLRCASRDSSAATPAQGSMERRRVRRGSPSGVRRGQLREARPLRAQKRPEAEPVVEPRQRRKVRRAAPETVGGHAERQVATDAGEAAREIHRLAMLGEARSESARAADLEAGDALEIVVELIERGERLHEGSRG